ncbi:MAG: alkaline phosphatase family protein [Caldilineaceae bacterium]|nr:alkaline phosphatase family protein [Caldilineaceae bacterium]MBP8107154.1 alkaline phosphatase family protein [Caldilineaceae bacterium]MBP8121498.1 alkaline phosphatase family protein [Caldilineaceae bacterium]MBP9073858.1 alkaline phosphatase family protein [Caldilineaceae bacterium]
MKRVIFLFLDGVGLGSDDPAVNPLAAAHYPTLSALMDGHPLTAASGRLTTPHAELIPTDAHLGIPGRPQSATGQAAIVTGANVPARLGRHYGPRPNQPVRDVIDEGSIFSRLRDRGQSSFFCNAYPEGFFAAVNRGKRLLSAIPYAVTQTGQVLPDHEDLRAGRALSADFTGQGWRSQLSYADAPVYTPEAAGRKLWALSQPHHFVFFEHWLTDILGHKQAHAEAVANFQVIDGFLAGLMAAADLAETSIIVAADHGNVEDCSHRAHTENPALTLLLGAGRAEMAGQIHGLDDFAPAIEGFLRLG